MIQHMKKLHIILLALLSLSIKAQEVVPGIIIAKVSAEYGSQIESEGLKHRSLVALPCYHGLLNMTREYPNATDPNGKTDALGRPYIDLTRTYRFNINTDMDLYSTMDQLKQTGMFEYVEYTTYSHSMYVPNDPLHTNQNHLIQSSILAAFDSTMGDTGVVIGITDTSMDILHEDLQGNVQPNYSDTIDGLDNDLDGYTDNYLGWDMDGNDNNLFFANDYHGTTVAINASATPDNSIGVVGSGFNCRYLPIKVSDNSTAPNIVTATGHQGIGYAVEHGCTVVNCSWGTSTWSQAGQDMVDYATINFDAVVVASAGNQPVEDAIYPAAFGNVISVTGVHNNDVFDNGSNPVFTYHDSVDIAAQGFDVYTSATVGAAGSNAVYTTTGGTSMAAPIVSGVVGLIRSKFPCLTATEVTALLIDSADVIDDMAQNIPYAGKIGKRLNALAPLQANLCTLTDISDRTNNHIIVYPNPTHNAFTWDRPLGRKFNHIIMYDPSGKTVMNTNISPRTRWIDVSDLPNGIYRIRLNGPDGPAVQNLIIERDN